MSRGRRPQGRRGAQANPGRVAAARALLGVEQGGHAEDLLAELAPAKDADRGLAWHLCLGVLRRRGTVDAVLSPLVRRGLDSLELPVLVTLRLGVFEALLSRTPHHAAASQAVEVVRALGLGRASGLVNAVLRKAVGATLPTDPLLDLPPWLQARWSEWPEWVACLREPAPVFGVARGPDAPRPEGCDDGVDLGARTLDDVFRLPAGSGAVPRLQGFAEGGWWVMDPASVWVADLAFEWSESQSPRVLDACAAPGGKSLRLASRGAEVRCSDLSPQRLARLAENAQRVGLSLPARAHDWLKGPAPGFGSFDVVLVDAPCTGLGTVRRHPEIKWRRLPTDPAAMALRQRRILASCADHVAPGGLLMYSVCSTEPEEGPAVAESLAGWDIAHRWQNVPPAPGADGFQAFGLRRKRGGT